MAEQHKTNQETALRRHSIVARLINLTGARLAIAHATLDDCTQLEPHHPCCDEGHGDECDLAGIDEHSACLEDGVAGAAAPPAGPIAAKPFPSGGCLEGDTTKLSEKGARSSNR